MVVRWVWVHFDRAIWFVAVLGVVWLQFDFRAASVLLVATLAFATAAGVGHFVVGVVIGPFAVGHRRGSFEETNSIGRTVLVTTLGLAAWSLVVVPQVVPRSVRVVAGALALVGSFAVRFLIRSLRSRPAASLEDERRVVVFGAVDAGRRLIGSKGEKESGSEEPPGTSRWSPNGTTQPPWS